MSCITSKHWLRFGSLGIALISSIIAGAASGSCVFGTNINFCEQFGLHCEAGQQCAAHQAVCIPIGGCGDGIVDPSKGEMCDDGNLEDTKMVDGLEVADGCRKDCKSDQSCGNKIMDFGEDCDDGRDRNGAPDSICDAICHFKHDACGNNTVDTSQGEQCDQGMDTTICNGSNHGIDNPANCHFAMCGDGYINTALSEDCDNVGGEDDKKCNGNHTMTGTQVNNSDVRCHFAKCGDGYANSALGEECDLLGGSDTQLCNGNQPIGGDQRKGNDQSNSLGAMCHVPTCGDGYVNIHNVIFSNDDVLITEECDRGSNDSHCNGNVGDTTDSKGKPHSNDPRRKCRKPSCGDGYINPHFAPPNAAPGQTGEECDDGSDGVVIDGVLVKNDDAKEDACRTNCLAPHCGDGVVDTKETCETDQDKDTCNGHVFSLDDYNGQHINNEASRCLSPSCGDGYINHKYRPMNADPNQTGEECDDGPLNSNTKADACRTNCRAPRCGDGVIDPINDEKCEQDDDCHDNDMRCNSKCLCVHK
jgi:hypothetical protein